MFNDYQVFLFDFDGLLVNTEKLHWEAYRQLCARHGYTLPWDFPAYCKVAHGTAHGLREALSCHLPEPWKERYQEKKAIYLELLQQGSVELMPGVERLLKALAKRGAPRAVVTHSSADQIAMIRKQLPILDTIPDWITREDYTHPKPNPECYQLAIDRLANPEDRVIGFEDSARGLAALQGTRAQPVLVNTIPSTPKEGVIHLACFEDAFEPPYVLD